MKTLHDTPTAKRVIAALETGLFDYMIAGGYPRDLAHSRQPKDLDIVVYNCMENSRWVSLLKDLQDNDLVMELNDKVVSYYQTQGKVLGVVKLKGDIDLILWDAFTQREVFNNFDFNINQYKLTLHDHVYTITYCGNTSNLGNLTQTTPLHGTTGEATKRAKRVQDIAESVGWKTCSVKTNHT